VLIILFLSNHNPIFKHQIWKFHD